MTEQARDYSRNRTNARRGADFERLVARKLVDRGWDVWRSSGSRTAADLVAMRHGQTPRVIQCKLDRHTLDVPQWHALWTLAQRSGCSPVVADRQGLWLVTGERPTFGRADAYLSPLAWDL